MSDQELMDENNSSEGQALVKQSKGSIAWGVGQILLFHLTQIPLAFMTVFLSLAVICVSQLAYVIPAIIVARRKGHEDTLKGIIIAASLTVLLNVACTGYLFYTLKF